MSLPLLRLGGNAPPVRDWAWQPMTPDPVSIPRKRVGDDSCAGTAYGTDYQLADGEQPESILTVWTYPVYAGDGAPDGFVIARKYEHITYCLDSAAPCTFEALAAAGEDQSIYWDLAEAQRAARNAACALASSAQVGRSDGYECGFGWSGLQ